MFRKTLLAISILLLLGCSTTHYETTSPEIEPEKYLFIRPEDVPVQFFDENHKLQIEKLVNSYVELAGKYHLVVNQCDGWIDWYADTHPEKAK